MSNSESKYDRIGLGYNNTRKADDYLTSRLLHHLNPEKSKSYLDIGCGTGNYTIALHKKGFRLVGLDPSDRMLKVAKTQCNAIEWKKGTAEDTGFPDEYFDGVTASLTLHHWEDFKRGFKELFRVMKSGARLVIFTSTPEQMKGYWLNHYFPKMMARSIAQMPGLDLVQNALNEAGLETVGTEKYFIKSDLMDKFLYYGKEDPELYFDEEIRKGISSFAALGNRDEVEQGLTKLRKDIDSGEIEKVIESYKNNHGDYLYVIARKPSE